LDVAAVSDIDPAELARLEQAYRAPPGPSTDPTG
jgi:hypothetical protein